jgi:membrane-bound lytic murein transglycosylase F
MKINYTFYLLLILLLTFVESCQTDNQKSKTNTKAYSETISNSGKRLKNILSKGKITVETDYNSHGYFLYRGTTMGFQYELLNSFADYLGVELELLVKRDLNEAFDDIENGDCDILAMDLAITSERKKKMMFTKPIYKSQQILVQKLPDNWRKMRTWDEIESHLLRDAIDLQGKEIYIQKGSVFVQRLNNINSETGGDMTIIEDDRSIDELIEDVAAGNIPFTVCDSHVAAINKKYHKNIDIETLLGSYSQNLAWAVPLESDSLLLEINKWLKQYKKSKEFYYVYNKYFKNSRTTMMAKSEYNSNIGNRISPFDDLIKEYSVNIHWDWRLLASLIYQESKFNPQAESWSGAFGLMQMMPETARKYNISDTSTADYQIDAGVKYLKSIDKRLKPLIADSLERIKFVMASYNVGLAHVLDAQRLAKKYNKDPEIWDENVDYYLLNKSKPQYYQDSVVYYGYCRGSEPYKYVNEIYKRYQNYSNLIKDDSLK